jgi:hypothetical protein
MSLEDGVRIFVNYVSFVFLSFHHIAILTSNGIFIDLSV